MLLSIDDGFSSFYSVMILALPFAATGSILASCENEDDTSDAADINNLSSIPSTIISSSP
jgi:hypothetical protein